MIAKQVWDLVEVDSCKHRLPIDEQQFTIDEGGKQRFTERPTSEVLYLDAKKHHNSQQITEEARYFLHLARLMPENDANPPVFLFADDRCHAFRLQWPRIPTIAQA